jgi:hypothetical protein
VEGGIFVADRFGTAAILSDSEVARTACQVSEGAALLLQLPYTVIGMHPLSFCIVYETLCAVIQSPYCNRVLCSLFFSRNGKRFAVFFIRKKLKKNKQFETLTRLKPLQA